ncbi:3-hydroxyacyl-CoA dehydrogenase NAD-binding domain-containing protein [Sphingobium sp.]|uniref:3-hydroxyacyl-CoA dehydrogenase NAD-binding domain-containing protein n=1 Tax=Sphingobium sp. TaxID=1912891 RepID=UPI003B3A94BB
MVVAEASFDTDRIAIRRDGSIAIIEWRSPPVNALSASFCASLLGVLYDLRSDRPGALILASGIGHFSAGKDLTEGDDAPPSTSLVDVQAAIERSPFPVIAAIDGAAMGAGLDLALTAHYRIAAPAARMALPEIRLGLAGGAQRLMRAVGLEKAMDMALTGRTVEPTEALSIGLIDRLSDADLITGAIAFARDILAEAMPLRRLRDESDLLPVPAEAREMLAAYRHKNAARFRGQIAPDHILRALEAGITLPFDEAVREEYRLCQQLLNSPQAKAQIYGFMAERKAASVPDVPAGTIGRQIDRVGIIGAGTMGGGIAMAFANAGYRVVMIDRAQDALDRGLAVIRRNYDRTVSRGGLDAATADERFGRITPLTDLNAVADCDLVIEAVFEQMDVKQTIFRQLDGICKAGAILATNTSCLDVNAIAAVTGRPQDVIGLHFFSPANVMKLLEVVRGRATATDVVATAMQLSRRIGKIAVLVGVCSGFVGNRILLERQYEAERLILEGVPPWQVDRLLYDFGFPMGPFAMADLVGLDVGWDEAASCGVTVQDRLCEMGRLGQKSGAGYYDYDASRVATPSPVTMQVIDDLRAARGQTAGRPVPDEDIVDRCLGLMINEGARILAEGIAIRASDIDVIWTSGYGWPTYRGGPMYHADRIGLPALCARLDMLRDRYGDRFEPAPLLRQLAERGLGFADFAPS